MTAKVILNPYAARWNARKRWHEAAAALKAAGLDFEMVESERRGHCTELAAQAVREGFSPVIAAGGDGTIGEVINGILRAAEEGAAQPPFGVLPLGTANDLVCNLELPLDLDEMAKILVEGHTRPMDLGSVNGRYFANNAALGLEPTVTLIQQNMTWAKGILRYLLAALTGIARNQHWEGVLEWDDGHYEGPLTLVTVGNCARTGGLFYMTPHASPFDGKLTATYGFRPTRWGVLTLLPNTMKPGEGSYVESGDMHEIHFTWLKVRLESPSPAHADGEIFSEAMTEVEYRVHPAKLSILMPA